MKRKIRKFINTTDKLSNMRRALFTATLAAFFAFASRYQQREQPFIQVVEEADLKDNSFIQKNLSLHFKTSRNAFYLVKINEQSVSQQDIQDTDAQTRKVRLRNYLNDGENTIEFVVRQRKAQASKKVTLEISDVLERVDGIDFRLCKRANRDYQQSPEQYEAIIRHMRFMNNILPQDAKTTTVRVVYENYCDCDDTIPAGGAQNAWPFGNEIVIGYGILAKYNCATEPRDTITHEFGHKLYKALTDSRRRQIDACYRAIASLKNSETIFDMFKDSNYTADKNSGHPSDNSQELFASAFLIHAQYHQEFLERINLLKEDEQKLAESVVDIITEVLSW